MVKSLDDGVLCRSLIIVRGREDYERRILLSMI